MEEAKEGPQQTTWHVDEKEVPRSPEYLKKSALQERAAKIAAIREAREIEGRKTRQDKSSK